MIGMAGPSDVRGAVRLVRCASRRRASAFSGMNQRTYGERDAVDFVIVGSGAAGGVLAKELSTAGFDVVVLEQGPWQQPSEFTHDELAVEREGAMLNTSVEPNQSFRTTNAEPLRAQYRARCCCIAAASAAAACISPRTIGAFVRSISWSARSGARSAAPAFADWPITYDGARAVLHEGRLGDRRVRRAGSVRSAALAPISDAAAAEQIVGRAARARGARARAARAGRADGDSLAAVRRTLGVHGLRPLLRYGCEFGAKSSTLVTVIPKAVATGRCEIRADSTVFRVETNARRPRDRRRCTGTRRARSVGSRRAPSSSRRMAPRRLVCC